MPTHVLLGAIAGLTIFLGIPIAQWRKAPNTLPGLLTLVSAGILIFLIIEVGYQAMEMVETSAKFGPASATLSLALIFILGLAAGLLGLAWIEEQRNQKHKAESAPLEVATMIALGIGLHNFAEGLAIGQSYSSGAMAFGTVLVVGFALHNATEGFGIAGPLVGQEVSWGRLIWLGLIGGAPTALGAWVGGIWVNPFVSLLFLSLATGSLIYVTRELLRIRFMKFATTAAMSALLVGLLLGFGTEIFVEVAQAHSMTQATSKANAVTLTFSNQTVSPASLSLLRSQTLLLQNAGKDTLVFEGNGLFTGEVVIPTGGKLLVLITGLPGQYHLSEEHHLTKDVPITVQPSGAIEPLTAEVDAVADLTILEGHERISKELHDRGALRQGPDPKLDLKRAGKHGGHPQHELLMGNTPDALALQKLLKAHGRFDPLNDALTAYNQVASTGSAPANIVNQRFQAVLNETEQARKAIAGKAYSSSSFRIRVAETVMDTAVGEYTTATQGGQIQIIEPGVPGKDNVIEYQDARGYLLAARDLLTRQLFSKGMPESGLRAYNKLLGEIFRVLDPISLTQPVAPEEVKTLVTQVEQALDSLKK